MGEDSFFDGVDITTEEFYERLKDKILHVTGDLMHLDLSMWKENRKQMDTYKRIVYWCKVCYNEYTIYVEKGGFTMDCCQKIKELRELTGMNRRQFCDYFGIPYRTVTEWERDNRHAPEYVLRLLEYYIHISTSCARTYVLPL